MIFFGNNFDKFFDINFLFRYFFLFNISFRIMHENGFLGLRGTLLIKNNFRQGGDNMRQFLLGTSVGMAGKRNCTKSFGPGDGYIKLAFEHFFITLMHSLFDTIRQGKTHFPATPKRPLVPWRVSTLTPSSEPKTDSGISSSYNSSRSKNSINSLRVSFGFFSI